MDERALQELLAMLGTDPRHLAAIQGLTPRGYSNPLEMNRAVGGEPGFYQGNKLGAYIYPPGPVQQSHPVLGAIAGMIANRRNAAERGRLERVAGSVLGPGAGRAPTAAAGAKAPTSPNKAASDMLDRLYELRKRNAALEAQLGKGK